MAIADEHLSVGSAVRPLAQVPQHDVDRPAGRTVTVPTSSSARAVAGTRAPSKRSRSCGPRRSPGAQRLGSRPAGPRGRRPSIPRLPDRLLLSMISRSSARTSSDSSTRTSPWASGATSSQASARRRGGSDSSRCAISAGCSVATNRSAPFRLPASAAWIAASLEARSPRTGAGSLNRAARCGARAVADISAGSARLAVRPGRPNGAGRRCSRSRRSGSRGWWPRTRAGAPRGTGSGPRS